MCFNFLLGLFDSREIGLRLQAEPLHAWLQLLGKRDYLCLQRFAAQIVVAGAHGIRSIFGLRFEDPILGVLLQWIALPLANAMDAHKLSDTNIKVLMDPSSVPPRGTRVSLRRSERRRQHRSADSSAAWTAWPPKSPSRLRRPSSVSRRWLDTSALACQLGDGEELALATRYSLTISPGIAAEDGATTDRVRVHEFVTQRILSHRRERGEEAAPDGLARSARSAADFAVLIPLLIVEERAFFRASGGRCCVRWRQTRHSVVPRC